MQYCSLQHRTLLLSPVTPTAGYCFHFGSILSFFLELFLHWSPVAYWVPTNLGSSSFSILSFCLSYCSWVSQGKNTEVVCHSLLQWNTFCQTSPPWPSHLGWPHTAWLGSIELIKAVCDQIGWFSVIMVSVCLPSGALSQHLSSYLSFSYLGHGVSLHGCSTKAQPLSLPWMRAISSQPPLLTLNME